jgi:MerR family transcriptional regulator, repressor of the yfmOP operon
VEKKQGYSKIEEVALRTGLTKRALRYYEDIQLLHPIRKESGYRLYAEEDIQKLIRIKELKESLGFTLNEVKDILDLEKKLYSILKNNMTDEEEIERSKERVQKMIELVENKKKTLDRAKAKYKEVLKKLEEISGQNRKKI